MPHHIVSPILSRYPRRVVAAVLLMLTFAVWPARADTVSVAAAASLNQVMQRLAAAFAKSDRHRLRVSYAASGVLARQIANGAPFQVFLSANERYVDYLDARGLTEGNGQVYAFGELVLFVARGSPLYARMATVSEGLDGLRGALDRGELNKLVIANPEHAPYGVAARQALRGAGLWQRLNGHLVIGENAAQAARFTLSGSADAGLIPKVIAAREKVAKRGLALPLATGSYTLLRQRAVLMAGAADPARRFMDFLDSPAARRLLIDSGFTLPGAGIR